MTKMRVLLANEPLSYREILAWVLMMLKPTWEVRVAEPGQIDAEVRAFSPHFVICNRVTPAVEAMAPAWVELYPDFGPLCRVRSSDGRYAVSEMEFTDLLGLAEGAEQLLEPRDGQGEIRELTRAGPLGACPPEE
ncbi:hypothetical protein GBA65_07750 [Rubrobacter marinus]|uniref:Uncharacterized protein n=1 Tax=Rubrobacter marinus TaxID=2653852 RepID=A0A6G8PW84_9ACTN|nr:hypothetical protein [Rubrobacter marinus]QIN78435.1 hypothetical protein GBA65_07750 [Rubrobacter marinus]